MSASAPREAERAALAPTNAPSQARLLVYLVCFALACGLFVLVHGGHGAAFWLLAAPGAAATLAGLLAGPHRRLNTLAAGVLALTALVLAAPIGEAPSGRAGALAAALEGGTVWPQILVALFANRVLVEQSELRIAAAWSDPLRPGPLAPAQSVGAALALGAALTLLFYQVTWQVTGGRAGGSVVVAALLGGTLIHHAILLLFFVVVAFVLDAARLHLRDRAALAALRAVLAERGPERAFAAGAAADERLAGFELTRPLALLRERLDGRRGARAQTAAGLAAFHGASRRFVKTLVPLLPLLGFLGTVIGLSIALAELPRSAGDTRAVGLDIGASLAGLAIKFETTLLGLIGAMAASLALGALEKAEAELDAECALLAGALRQEDGRAP